MATEAVGEWSGHPVPAGLGLVEQGLDLALGATAWSLSEAELTEAIVSVDGLVARLEATKAVLLRERVSREAPDARGRQGVRTVNLLRARCRASGARAGADVANARVTCPQTGDLRGLGAALAAGQVSADHVDVARRTLTRLPGRVLREHREEVDALLTGHARQWDPSSTDLLARRLLSVLAPDRADRYDEHAHERRHLGVSTDSTGMVLVRGQLDPAGGLTVTSVLEHVVAADRAAGTGTGAGTGAGEGEGGVVVPDLRTRGQRRADALVRIGVLAGESLGLTPPPAPTEPSEPSEPSELAGVAEDAELAERAALGEPVATAGSACWCSCGHPSRQRTVRSVPRVVVITTPDQLAGVAGAGAAVTSDGSLVDTGTLTRLACDAMIDRVILAPDGRTLAMDTLGRLATPAQQHALAVRDRGCTWPGCTTPPSLCEAHHVTWWSRGGPTTVANLALLCHRHHTQIHAQPDDRTGDGWQMIMRDGLPWFRPPERLDPTRTLQRNTFHQVVDATRRTGRRWNATMTPQEPDPP